jgi:hypothetical protein
MKKIVSIIVLVVFTLLLIASSRKVRLGSVKGTVNPTDAGVSAWAISPKDTFKSIVTNGMFIIPDVKPGLYTIVIEAKAPYKNGGRPDVTVADAITDVGEIILTK